MCGGRIYHDDVFGGFDLASTSLHALDSMCSQAIQSVELNEFILTPPAAFAEQVEHIRYEQGERDEFSLRVHLEL